MLPDLPAAAGWIYPGTTDLATTPSQEMAQTGACGDVKTGAHRVLGARIGCTR